MTLHVLIIVNTLNVLVILQLETKNNLSGKENFLSGIQMDSLLSSYVTFTQSEGIMERSCPTVCPSS